MGNSDSVPGIRRFVKHQSSEYLIHLQDSITWYVSWGPDLVNGKRKESCDDRKRDHLLG